MTHKRFTVLDLNHHNHLKLGKTAGIMIVDIIHLLRISSAFICVCELLRRNYVVLINEYLNKPDWGAYQGGDHL